MCTMFAAGSFHDQSSKQHFSFSKFPKRSFFTRQRPPLLFEREPLTLHPRNLCIPHFPEYPAISYKRRHFEAVMSFLANLVREQRNVLKSVGGWKNAFFRLAREGNVRTGTCVGGDKYGNKYYENNTYMFSRNRFVEYPYGKNRLDYDASQVPSEWHRWLHYMTDDPPTSVPPEERKFFKTHIPNRTGSKKEYVPYSTTAPKIHTWEPPRNN